MSPFDQTDDAELLRLMNDGDEEAFAALYRRHQRSVYRFAAHMSGSAIVAEDVTQEVFMLLMHVGEKYDETRGSLQAFLLGVARNHVRRALERERHGATFAGTTEPRTFEDKFSSEDRHGGADDPFERLARDEALSELRRAIGSLPARYRETIVLCELHEMSYEEAARVIGCAVGTVRSRLHRARHLLGDKMRDSRETIAPTELTARCFT